MERHSQQLMHFHTPPATADAVAQVALLVVHGRNQDPAFMRQQVVQRLGWTHLPAVYPAAVEQTWYPAGFMAPVAENAGYLEDALLTLDKALAFLGEQGYPPHRVLLIGFSQGACLLSEYVRTRPQRYHGLAAFTGGYVGPAAFVAAPHGQLHGMPVYLSTAENDAWVPAVRTRATANLFEAMGAAVLCDIFKDRPHEVSESELSRVQEMFGF